jgi:5-methylthioadenosine/S-adenosylhomocysteine deaminase
VRRDHGHSKERFGQRPTEVAYDAAESTNNCDLFQVMKFASLIHRAARVDASLQQAPDVLRMATRNGAAALGHETGQLAAGAKAGLARVLDRIGS